jgi:DNA-binding PadR family transcriptional regulator
MEYPLAQLTPDDTILGLLAITPRHGYELVEIFRDLAQLGRVWTLSTSQVYAVLKRLEQQGLTAGHEVIVPDAPIRTEYRLTEAGQARLHEWLNDEPLSGSVKVLRVEFISRLYVLHLLNKPAQPLIRRQREACQKKRAELLSSRLPDSPPVAALALDLAIRQQEVALQWLDYCEQSLSSYREQVR